MTTRERGYGQKHRRERERLRPLVEAGTEVCTRCFVQIPPVGEPCPRCGRPVSRGNASTGTCGWDVGHDDYDRDLYTGPEHACCNRKAGAKRGARIRSQHVWSRQWLID